MSSVSELLTLRPTPLVPVQLEAGHPVVWTKLEYLNPSGSTKDRIATYIVRKGFEEGVLRPGRWLIEASSGSTSIAFARACACTGLRFLAVMPEGVSNERVLMIRAFGGEVCFTPKEIGVAGSVAETERLAKERDAFLPAQFSNPDNAAAHQFGTAREMLEQLPAGVVPNAVVSGVGTGGTLVGLFRGLCPGKPGLRAVLARPVEITEDMDHECCSCCFSSQIPGVLEGVSKIFRPEMFDSLVTMEVRQEDAIRATRQLMRQGFPVGPSSGLNYMGAVMAARELGDGCVPVTVFPDRMERYFTTRLFGPYR